MSPPVGDIPTAAPRPRMLSVSAAARLLGVSPSSLRAWAAAGQVPHVRTPGGHRRFELDQLVAWLTARGGAPPEPGTRPQELVPTRIDAVPEIAAALRSATAAVTADFEEQVRRTRPAGARMSAGRGARIAAALECLADGLERGDLSACYRDAEWEGFRQGAAGQPGDAAVTEALALRGAIGRVLAGQLQADPAVRRTLERALDRMAVRVAAGYADGVRQRLRAAHDRAG